MADSAIVSGAAARPWFRGTGTPRALVIVNEAAGSVGPGARDKLLAALAAHKIEAVSVVSDMDALKHADGARADVIIVLGGDGTAAAAARMFSGGGAPLVLLPGGTLNVLPHALYGDLAWPEALDAALSRGRAVRLTGGKANGKTFYVAALFGAPTLLARVREAARAGRFASMFARLRDASRRTFSRRLAAKPANGFASRAEAVGVLCPAYSGGVESDTLEWVRLDVGRITDLLRVGLRAVIGGWREDPTIDLSHTTRGTISSIGLIPATLDGEPTSFAGRVRIAIVRQGPKVLTVD